MADCLYECLKEASLERFHKRFCSQGLVNCNELINLSMHDYSMFGIVSMEDRLRLYQLVQIMRSVQHEGTSGNQGNVAEQTLAAASSQNYMAALSKRERNRNQNNRLNVTSEVEVRVCAPEGTACEPDCGPTATLQSEGGKDAAVKSNGSSLVPAHKEAMLTVAFRKGSDSPLFHCRKTLTFSGSDTEEDVTSGKQSCNHNNIVGVTTNTSGVDFALPNQPVTGAQNAVDVKHRTEQHQQTQNSSENPQRKMSAPHFQFVPLNGNRRSDAETHAYFPVPNSPPPEKITYVETVIHTTGYNYGLPNTLLKSPGSATSAAGKCIDRIKVCVRKRPLLAREVKHQEVDIVKMTDRHVVGIEEVKLAVDLTKFLQKHMFAFDEVFDEKCSNETLYTNTVRSLVSCIFDRGSATCFAFGQTGAGKTYTLMGTKTVPGLYQLAGRDILDMVHSGHYDNDLHLWISYYEIYCGQLFDLLNKRKRLHVRENGKQKVCISGLMETEVKEPKRLVQVVHYGNTVRSKGSTGVNPTSSRSHAILQLEVRDSRDARVGRMSFIDLAGSERASDMTNSNKQTRMEGAEINQSLLALKECIRCIDQDFQHTPYRQSKLTHILRDSFNGNSQTVMIANISPCQSACENTLNTLRYADRVKALKKDTPPKVTRMPSTHDSTKSSKKVAPSLFHPSNIQLSSTPKVSRTRSIGSHSDAGNHGDTLDLTKVLQEAYDTPVRGHRIRISLSERRRQQRELQKQQASGANGASVDNSIKSIKSFESCDSGPPLAENPDGNTSHSSSGSGKQVASVNGEAHQPPSVWKERRLLNKSQGKPVIVRHIAEEASSPGSSSGSALCGFLRHASRHVKTHSSIGHSDIHQGSGELLSPDQVTIDTSHFSPKSNNKIFEEHKEIMSHLDSVIGRARAVMTKAAGRKRIEFGSSTPSDADTPTEGPSSKTELSTSALSAENIFTDAPKSTSVRRKLAWDSDSRASHLNGSQPQSGVAVALLTLPGSKLSTGGATIAADSTEPGVDDVMLPAWATRESVMMKQSSEDMSLISNTSDLSFANSDTVMKSLESLNTCNLQGEYCGNRCLKQQTWPQPSSGKSMNGTKEGEVKDSGKYSDNSVGNSSDHMSREDQTSNRQMDYNASHDKGKAESPERKCGTTESTSHSALPMGDDFLKVLETVKSVQDQLDDEKVDQLHAARQTYYEHFHDLLHMSTNVRRGFNVSAGGFATQLSTEKIIQKLDAAIEKIASETSIIKQLSPRMLCLKRSEVCTEVPDNEQCFSGAKENNTAMPQDAIATPAEKLPSLTDALYCDTTRRDGSENFHQCNTNGFECVKNNHDGKSFVLSRALPVGRNIIPGTYDDQIACSRNKSSEGAIVPLHSPKRKDCIAIHEGSAFSKVSDKTVKSQPDNSDSGDSHPIADTLQSHKPLQNINVSPHVNNLKKVRSPIRIEKLSGAIFSPIQCFPVTPRDNHVISVPSIVTKALLKGHSEPVVGDAHPHDGSAPLSGGGSEATQSTGDIVTTSIITRSILHCLVSSDTGITGDRKPKDDASPKMHGISVGDGDTMTHPRREVIKQEVLHMENDKQDVTKTGFTTVDCVDSREDPAAISVSIGSPNGRTPARESSPMKSRGDSCDQSPHNAAPMFLQSPGSQSSSHSSSVQSSSETALQRAQRLLVGEHEQELAEVTSLCKQEMRLLMAVRTGEKNFEDYLSVLDNILLSKMAALSTLRSNIREFHNVSQTD